MSTIINTIISFFSTVIEYIPKFLPAAGMTIGLSFLSIIAGTIIGVVFAFMKLSRFKVLQGISNIYITIVRGTPLLLQLIFVYSALPKLGLQFPPFTAAVIALAFHNGAYIAEIFRGAISSIAGGQVEAARSLGMTQFQAMKRVVLPQAVKRAIPPLGNQFIIAIKDSSLASAITITEIIMVTRRYVSATYSVYEMFTVAAIYYLVFTYALSKLVNLVEKKLQVSEKSKDDIVYD
ncbi:MAG: amino acid ABC transporter permease [Tissierella sp.]|uniref:amino acid ABC transporter permease n=1 Tax=Tissierella sp. TaxID=41274 RepID=UPI003F976DC0